VSGRIVLVTGAGGSIGSELCRQIASAVPSTLLLLEKSENSLFYILREIRERFPAVRVKPFLVDIAHEDLVREIFRNQRPNLIFHAAAYKHVGLLETHPHEAIRNNVLGTRNVGLAALESVACRFVNISTDKAVNPSSYMGLSKKLTELCIQELARQKSTRFMNVRFGNVAGSTGSVLRLFWDQIQKGQPLQVTDPRATRYFMTIAEAVYLILRAATLGHGGETFIFDMGDPVNIYELAKTVSLFAGLVPEKELPIQFIGLNEGEKVCEQLWEEWEHPIPTAYNRILAIADVDPLSFSVFETIQQLEAYLLTDDRMGLLTYLHSLMPRFAASRQQCSPVNEETTWTPTVASREVV
jgi:FlaA1/EpsC-like NDP-sugar epimerase